MINLVDKFSAITSEILEEVSASPEELKDAIDLESGDVAWNVDVGGVMQTWNLKYKDWNELPISNDNYYQFIKYQEKYFRIKRVFSDCFWITSEVNVVSTEDK